MNWFKTNKQLRAINAHLLRDAEMQAKSILNYRLELQAKQQEIRALQKERDSALASYTRLLCPTKPRQALTKAPNQPVKSPKTERRYIPSPAGHSDRTEASVRPEPSHDVASFLAGAVTGYVVTEIFASDSSSSSKSDDSFSSGSGGDFSGGGASGEF